MLYDRTLVSNAGQGWLDERWWARRGTVVPASAGRGAVSLIEADAKSLVLRHYRRGGLMARVAKDRYLWRGVEATRSFQEWRLLHFMRSSGLPVPVPLVAGFLRVGRSYRADLLMERLPGTQSLAERLQQSSQPFERWVAIGRCIKRFHDLGICHADLNAHNILLSEDHQAWLIDFDKARRRESGMWRDDNLARLYRSVEKVTMALPEDRFTRNDWASFLSGYLAPAGAK